MKTLLRIVVVILLLTGTFSTVTLADGPSNPPICPNGQMCPPAPK